MCGLWGNGYMKMFHTQGKYKQWKGLVVFFRFQMVWYGVNMVNSKVMYHQALENFGDFAKAYGIQTLNIEQDTACHLGSTE